MAIWNPYVTERLLLGQVPTLLGYACLPWIVVVGRSRLSSGRRLALLFLVAAPAAVTPWGGVLALVAAVLVELRADRTPRRVLLVTGVGVLWCSPWLVPALLTGGVAADPDGPAAFALADDSGLGAWVSALMGGGVWATGAQPLSRTDPVAIASSLALVVLALGGVAVLTARSSPGTAGSRRGARALVTAMVACLALLGPATLAWWGSGPGLEVLVMAAAGSGRGPRAGPAPDAGPGGAHPGGARRPRRRLARPSRGHGRIGPGLRARHRTRRGVGAGPRPFRAHGVPPRGVPAGVGCRDRCREHGRRSPTVLSLPWQPLRRPTWAGDPAFLDPLPRAVPGTTLVSTALSVERGGTVVVVDDTPVDEVWATGEVSADSLRRHHVTHVVEWLGTPGALASSHDGWRLVHSGAEFRVWDVAPDG